MISCKAFHKVYASEWFWKLQIKNDFPLYVSYIKQDYRLTYKFLSVVDSLKSLDPYKSSNRCPLIEDFDIDKHLALCKQLSRLSIALIYPYPPFPIFPNTRSKSECHHFNCDMYIKIEEESTFTVSYSHRFDLLPTDIYFASNDISMLPYVLSQAKEKGYLLIRSSVHNPCGISHSDVAFYPDLFRW